MSVNSVSNNNSANQIYDLLQQSNSQKAPETAAGSMVEDVVELSNQKPQGVDAMKADLRKNMGVLRQMVETLLQKQGGYAQGAGADFLIKIDQQTQDWAKEQIAEDGYWGVNKTAERILDFAKSISGGDSSKIGLLRDAVMKGFKDAEKAWGGKLPDISQQTIDKVMAGFDEWENAGKKTVE